MLMLHNADEHGLEEQSYENQRASPEAPLFSIPRKAPECNQKEIILHSDSF